MNAVDVWRSVVAYRSGSRRTVACPPAVDRQPAYRWGAFWATASDVVALRLWLSAMVLLGAAAGCAGPGPRLSPAAPVRSEQVSGGTLNWYDMDADGRADYGERQSEDGRIVELRYLAGKSSAAQTVDLSALPESERRDLIIILDSIPYHLAEAAWKAGMLRHFPRPTRIIAPFPVMTDVALVDFFHQTPGVAIESDYYDGQRETDGYNVYLKAGVSIWHEHVDYAMPHIAHGSAYMDQLPWFDHELRRIQDAFERSQAPVFVGYCVGTSALGALQGREGHETGLSRMDRFCRTMVYRSRGRVRITLLSDHGHNLVTSTRIPLSDLLKKAGYNVTNKLIKPKDIVLPEFAMATCSAIYTNDPAAVAADVVKIEGMELAAYPHADGSLVVLSPSGRAKILRSESGYRYEASSGDPLVLLPILERLQAANKINPDGFVSDAVLLEATADATYPDAVDRLWRAFHEQFQHTPNVLISVADGKHTGSKFQSEMIKLRAAHGNLRPLSTFGFAATTAGELPATLRMRELAPALNRAGVHVLKQPSATLTTVDQPVGGSGV